MGKRKIVDAVFVGGLVVAGLGVGLPMVIANFNDVAAGFMIGTGISASAMSLVKKFM